MNRRDLWAVGLVVAFVLAAPDVAGAQANWKVTLTPPNPLPIGSCGAVLLQVFDPKTRETPRDAKGTLISMADFDMTISAPDGKSLVGLYRDKYHWSVCACQVAPIGTVGTITATYPGALVTPATRAANGRSETTTTFVVSKAVGAWNPPDCPAPPQPGAIAGGAAPPPVAPPPAPAPAPAAPPPAPAPTPLPPPAPAPPPPPPAPAPAPAPAAAPIVPVPPPPPAPTSVAGVPTGGGRVIPVAGPAPALKLEGTTATQVGLSWAPLEAVARYRLTRSQPNTPDQVTEGPPTQFVVSFFPRHVFLDEKLLPGTSGTYEVRAFYPDGREGVARIPFSTLPPNNPPALTAAQTGAGKVMLRWGTANCCPSYAVFGPGSAQGGVKVGNAVGFEVTGVPLGSHEWAVASYYEPGPIVSPAADFARVTHTVITYVEPPPILPVFGRYRISITGARAIRMSFDDQLSRDGRGDEVYAAAYVRRYDRRDASVKEGAERVTLTYGDVNGFGTTRVQAGTASATGGIQDTDPIPANSDPTKRTLPPSDIAFPLRLWEGTLTDSADVLVLSPTLWERDGSNQPYLQWRQQMESITPTLFARPEIQEAIVNGQFGSLLFGTTLLQDGTVDAALWVLNAFSGLAMAKLILDGDVDRAIGILKSGLNDLMIPNTMVVLTREIIEAGLAPLPPGTAPLALPEAWPRMPQPGVLMIPFVDGFQFVGALPVRPARYELYLLVERVP